MAIDIERLGRAGRLVADGIGGAELDLPADEVRDMLAGDAYGDEVRYDQRHAASLGIRGVPFFVIDNKYGISGAQPADLIRDALQQAWDEAHPLTLVGSASGADGMCDDDGCVIEPVADERAAR